MLKDKKDSQIPTPILCKPRIFILSDLVNSWINSFIRLGPISKSHLLW